MIYAPIAITTINRWECLEKCIKSLQHNSWAVFTDLYISVDYPPSSKYKEGNDKIVRYLKTGIHGFHSVSIFFQEKNLGALENLKWLCKYILERYDRIIILEDDNELAPGFIQFCDKGLELFNEDNSIVGINASDYVWCGNGFIPPIRSVANNDNNIEKRQLLFHAFATWKNEWQNVNAWCESEKYYEVGRNNQYMKKLYSKSKSFFYQYIYRVCITKDKLPWCKDQLYPIDSVWDTYMLLFDKYVISPIEPMMRDLGVDGNGVNYTTAFENAEELKTRIWKVDNEFNYHTEVPIKVNGIELQLHDENMYLPFHLRLKTLIKYILKYRCKYE